MDNDYDVIVVGARVAGASTAMLLARLGHRVLLIDRVKMPADTLSTHAMLRSGVLQLQRWGVLEHIIDAATPRVRSVTLGFGEERIPVKLSTDYGVDALFAPRRHLIDYILAQAAVADGAEMRDATRLKDLMRNRHGRVTGAILDTGEVTARWIVGADGVHSKVASLVGATSYQSHPPLNTVHYSYYTGVDHQGFWFQFTPGVNAGLIQTNDATLVFTGRPVSLYPAFREDPEAEFHRLLNEAGEDLAALVAAGTRIDRFRGTPGLPGFIRRPWGPGWALVGDAGYTKDPISAHGMSDALRDAELCANALHHALRDPTAASDALETYQQNRDRLSLPMYDASEALAGYQWDAAQASRHMRTISATVHHECGALEALAAPVGVSA